MPESLTLNERDRIVTPEEEIKIEKWGQSLEDDIHIKLILNKDKRSYIFQNFIDNLIRICPKVQAKIEQDDESTAPEIQIRNIRYHAIPLDKELDPFLGVIGNRESYSKALSSSVHERLGQIEMPALLKVYITPQCPFCPITVKQLLSLAASTEFISLSIIDGALFSEMAASDGIHAAPTILLDEQFRWNGSIEIHEIVNIILNRDPSQLSASSLTSLIKDGNAAGVAEMMVSSGRIYPAFMELLVHEKWPIRLGAMVVFETIATKNSQLLIQIIPFLWERFSQVDDTIKGDILYLYGQSKSKKVIPKLESVVMGRYRDDVKEAAEEALQEIKSCHGFI